MIISEKEFVRIINRLKQTDETVDKANEVFRECLDSEVTDFVNAASLMICHKDIVIDILQKMFDNDDTISWWIYDLEYGTKYKNGCITEQDGTIIDVSTAEKLYKYLVENIKK